MNQIKPTRVLQLRSNLGNVIELQLGGSRLPSFSLVVPLGHVQLARATIGLELPVRAAAQELARSTR